MTRRNCDVTRTEDRSLVRVRDQVKNVRGRKRRNSPPVTTFDSGKGTERVRARVIADERRTRSVVSLPSTPLVLRIRSRVLTHVARHRQRSGFEGLPSAARE